MHAIKTFVYRFYQKADGSFSAIHEKSAKPMATIALIQDDLGMWHRGIAVCNPKDAFEYATGRNKAIGWATSAMVNQKCVSEFPFRMIRGDTLSPIAYRFSPRQFHDNRQSEIYRGTFGAELTAYEQELVADKPQTAEVKG